MRLRTKRRSRKSGLECEVCGPESRRSGWPANSSANLRRKHGSKLPEFPGDLTPYWEDGAGSTARETAMNRASADRLSQASTLFAMRAPKANPAARFDEAWKNVLLYSEHTWGARCSISKPDDPFTLDQWKVKGGFAVDADRHSRQLLKRRCRSLSSAPDIDVFNTTQWERSDLAVVPAAISWQLGRGRSRPRCPLPAPRLRRIGLPGQGCPALWRQALSTHRGSPANKGKAKATEEHSAVTD